MKELVESSKPVRLLVFLALCVPALGLAATPRLALEPVKMSVSFADLDLDRAEGIESLYQRMRSAAAVACGPSTLREAGSLKALRASQECYKELLDQAVSQVDNAALTKRHFG
jgi:UrcA family protein